MSAGDGGPAYPSKLVDGMSLRDRFAIALAPVVVEKYRPDSYDRSEIDTMAGTIWFLADAILKAREDT